MQGQIQREHGPVFGPLYNDMNLKALKMKMNMKKLVVGLLAHFEPLRHYAEVHLLMEPKEPGSGLEFAADCSEDDLDRAYQRLILSHLEEKAHLGVLTGSQITDMKITLITGRARQKHTEGGDFRQATYRAVRQGLKKAKSVLLEPCYNFRIEVPLDSIGRAMSDVQKMYGSFLPPVSKDEMSIFRRKCTSCNHERLWKRNCFIYKRNWRKLTCMQLEQN